MVQLFSLLYRYGLTCRQYSIEIHPVSDYNPKPWVRLNNIWKIVTAVFNAIALNFLTIAFQNEKSAFIASLGYI